MRCIALFTLAALGMLHSSLALVDARERTDVDVWANAWDKRRSGDGCSPKGCKPELTRDRDLDDESRWSCSKDLKGSTCKICYEFDEPQDIEEVCFALWKGDERVRKIKMAFEDSDDKTTTEYFKSSGKTEKFECMEVHTDETKEVCMRPRGLDSDEWLSILEVKFLVK